MKKIAANILRLLIVFPFLLPAAGKMARTVYELPWERGEYPSLVQSLLIVFLFASVAHAVQQLLHLAGRLICGELAGYRVTEINIFNLRWKFSDGRHQFNFLRGLRKYCTCAMLSPESEPKKHVMVLATIGSAVIDFLVSAVLLVLSSQFSHFLLFSCIAYVVAMLGFIQIITYAVPVRFLYGENKGCFLLELLRHPKAPHSMWVAHRVTEKYTCGVSVKDMPAEWFEIPSAAEMKNMHLAHIGALTCGRLMEEHRFAEADRLAEALLKEGKLRAVNRYFLMMYRVRCELMGENRPEVVEGLLTSELKKWLEKAAKLNPDIHATLYALALLHEKNTEKAQRIAAEIEQQVKTTENSVNAVEARNFMADVDRLAG